MPVQLRPCTAQDRELMLRVYASTREAELAQTRWSAEDRGAFVRMQFDAQLAHYLRHYPRSQCEVIVLVEDGQARDVGRLWLERRSTALHVLDISLLSDARGLGIGTHCLEQLKREAHGNGLALTIFVELHNPARRLYERLGFEAVDEPQGLYQRMACRPPATINTKEVCLP
jgi:ribosomal protein S18 acetylase RimI-like enzyme